MRFHRQTGQGKLGVGGGRRSDGEWGWGEENKIRLCSFKAPIHFQALSYDSVLSDQWLWEQTDKLWLHDRTLSCV